MQQSVSRPIRHLTIAALARKCVRWEIQGGGGGKRLRTLIGGDHLFPLRIPHLRSRVTTNAEILPFESPPTTSHSITVLSVEKIARSRAQCWNEGGGERRRAGKRMEIYSTRGKAGEDWDLWINRQAHTCRAILGKTSRS